MDKSKAYLVDGIYTSKGTIATMYADSLDDLGYDDYSGVDKNGLASGSVAYDKSQNVAVYDGSHWVKDDGTEITNYVKDWVIPKQTVVASKTLYFIPQQTITFSGTSVDLADEDWSVEPTSGDTINVLYDGTLYENVEVTVTASINCHIGNLNDYPFSISWVSGGGVGCSITCTEEGSHTVSVYHTQEDAVAVLQGVTINANAPETPLMVEFDGNSYTVYYDKGYVTQDFVILYVGEWQLFTRTEGEHTISAYVIKVKPTVFARWENVIGEQQSTIYMADLPTSLPTVDYMNITCDGVKYLAPIETVVPGMQYYGEVATLEPSPMPSFENYPFFIMFGSVAQGIYFADGNPHTLEFSGNVTYMTIFPNTKVTVIEEGAQLSNSSLLEDGKSYRATIGGEVFYGRAVSEGGALRLVVQDGNVEYTIGYGGSGTPFTYIACPFSEGKIDVALDLIKDGSEDEGGNE